MGPALLAVYGQLCGWTLARAHARSGDRIAIAAYLGSGDAFDRALCEFAEAYADQSERDYAALGRAADSGAVAVEPRPLSADRRGQFARPPRKARRCVSVQASARLTSTGTVVPAGASPRSRVGERLGVGLGVRAGDDRGAAAGDRDALRLEPLGERHGLGVRAAGAAGRPTPGSPAVASAARSSAPRRAPRPRAPPGWRGALRRVLPALLDRMPALDRGGAVEPVLVEQLARGRRDLAGRRLAVARRGTGAGRRGSRSRASRPSAAPRARGGGCGAPPRAASGGARRPGRP